MASVLIIDDEENIRLLLRMILQEEGHEVLEAGDGQEGLALYRRKPDSLVFCDLCMPGKSGAETIRELCAEFPGARVVVMSGDGAREALSGLAPTGGQPIFGLDKPFGVEAVLSVLNESLERNS